MSDETKPKRYKVIHNYLSYSCRPPIIIPAGTILEWWAERGFYLSQAIDGVCVPVGKWAVEAWKDFFQEIKE